jgi:hypothetical protein
MSDTFYSVHTDGHGRFIVLSPDGLTWEAIYPSDQMREADAHARLLNTPLWLAMKPAGLEVLLLSTDDDGDKLLELLDRPWLYESPERAWAA